MQALIEQLKRISPVQLAFFGSLLLSLIAVSGVVTIGKDGAFYVDIAQSFLDQGIAGAFQRFNWPWFSLLIGSLHWLTGIPLEVGAYLLCALFLAGTCALLVDCVVRKTPEAGYWACLVVLAMPSFNTFRGDIIREFGFWFFSTLALWLALQWQERGGWARAALIQLAIVAAALFRLEAFMLCAALLLWQLPGMRTAEGRLRIVQLNALPVLGGVLGVALLLAKSGLSQERASYYLQLLDPRQVTLSFHELAQQFADTLKAKYSKDEAGRIIFFGVLADVLIKFIKMLGPFALIFLSRRSWDGLGASIRRYAPFSWGWLLYLGVLMLFFFHEQFMNSRYACFLNMLVVPVVAIVLAIFVKSQPRFGNIVVGLALLIMLDNVISLGAKKTHYVEAGHWLAQHVERRTDVFYEDSRIAYYAGWGYPGKVYTREEAMSPAHASEFKYFLVEAGADESWLQDWLNAQHKQVLAQFSNRKGDTVMVIGE